MSKQAIKKLKGKIKTLQSFITLIENIPLQKPITFSYQAFIRNPVWEKCTVNVVCIITKISALSMAVNLIAVDKRTYPIDIDFDNKRTNSRLAYKNIKNWKLFDLNDLPLCVSYDLKFPLFDMYLKGKISEAMAIHRMKTDQKQA